MSAIKITLQQLYVGIIQVLPNYIDTTGIYDWEEALENAVDECVLTMKDSTDFLDTHIANDERIILGKIAQIPDIEIIDLKEGGE